jgi:hypothetical protein
VGSTLHRYGGAVVEATELARKAGEIASHDIGLRESPPNSNDGPRIRDALAYCNLAPGNPWCASMCSLWVHEAGAELGVTPKFRKSGSALGLLRRNSDLVFHDLTAADLPCIGINRHSDGIHGHAFVIVGLGETDGLVTIEPNSNPKGSREGGGCYVLSIRRTDDADRAGYVRIA